MKIVTIASTKGGVAKTTTTASIGGALAACGIKTLLLDTNLTQPSLSSCYSLDYTAPGGIVEMLILKDFWLNCPEKIISKTNQPNLDIICSNDQRGELLTVLSGAADGRLRLRSLLKKFNNSPYDVVLIDTIGTSDITVDMAILAADMVISPLVPEVLAAREFQRGTLAKFESLQLYQELGINLPPLKILFTKAEKTNIAKTIIEEVKTILDTLNRNDNFPVQTDVIKTVVAKWQDYEYALLESRPVHQISERSASIIYQICCYLFPEWQFRFKKLLKKTRRS